ncbi:MAG: LUD domain-containing protein [Bacteroidales bacterium]|nr:LUD domain-containing protein [Bacteroidales bacterium]
MDETTSREKILKKIRNALINKTDKPATPVDYESNIYLSTDESLDLVFAKEFTTIAGKFVYCQNENEFIAILRSLINEEKWEKIFCIDEVLKSFLKHGEISFTSDEADFKNIKVGITRCEYLIARLGSVMVSSKQASGRRLNIFPESHIVLAYSSQLVPDIKHALKNIKKKYKDNFPSLVSIISGPSRTADIEKTLVMGAHGPRNLYVFLIDNSY